MASVTKQTHGRKSPKSFFFQKEEQENVFVCRRAADKPKSCQFRQIEFPIFVCGPPLSRHCEERSDAAIRPPEAPDPAALYRGQEKNGLPRQRVRWLAMTRADHSHGAKTPRKAKLSGSLICSVVETN